MSNLVTIICVGYHHSFSLAVLLSSNELNQTMAYMLMSSDFLFNTWSCLKMIMASQKGTENKKNAQDNALKCLAVKEFLEILVPATNCLSFMAAYFGPNAEIIGKVKNSYWIFVEVQSLWKKLSNLAIFLVIDAARGLTFGLVLLRYCKLDIYAAYCDILVNYGTLILFYRSLIINSVSI